MELSEKKVELMISATSALRAKAQDSDSDNADLRAWLMEAVVYRISHDPITACLFVANILAEILEVPHIELLKKMEEAGAKCVAYTVRGDKAQSDYWWNEAHKFAQMIPEENDNEH